MCDRTQWWIRLAFFPVALSSGQHQRHDGQFKIDVVNHGPDEILMYWVPPSGQNNRNHGRNMPAMPELKERIPSHGMRDQWTQKGHTFVLSVGQLRPPKQLGKDRPASIRPTGAGRVECRTRGKTVECRESYTDDDYYKGDKWDKLVSDVKANCSTLLQHDVDDEAHFCNPEFRDWFWAQCHYESKEEDLVKEFQNELPPKWEQTLEQVSGLQNFTEVGFEVSKIPEDLLKELQDFWHTYRLTHSHPENHPKMDPVNPGCLSDTWMLELPEKKKRHVADMLRPLVANWSGTPLEDLEWTAFYGVRLYRKGAMLEWHADRRDTHALSIILQLGVLGFGDEPAPPWPLEIYSHDGVKHTVPQRPGELVLYESATCAHARPGRFQGRETANLFVHYAPKGWPDKYDARLMEAHEL